MPIFTSKLYDRESLKLKRVLSIDKLRLNRVRGAHRNNTTLPDIEFTVVKGEDISVKNMTYPSSLSTAGILSAADSLFVPHAEFMRSSSQHSCSSISVSVSSSSSVRIPSRTSNSARSSKTTKRTSRSPIVPTHAITQEESVLNVRGDSETGRSHSSQAGTSIEHSPSSALTKRNELMLRARSTPDLQERSPAKPRPKSPLPPQPSIQDKTDDALTPFSSDSQMEPPRCMWQPNATQSPSTELSLSSMSVSELRRVKGLAIPLILHKPSTASCDSSATTPALTSALSPLSPFNCQKSSPSYPTTPVSRRGRNHSFKFSRGYKSSGSISDSSYGSPLSDIGISIKTLLSKPASTIRTPAGTGSRSEPEANSALAKHRRRAEPTTPTSVHSFNSMGRPLSSDPKMPRRSPGGGEDTGTSATGLGQGRGTADRSGVLDRRSASASEGDLLHNSSFPSRTDGRSCHTRQYSASRSLSSPSEGGSGITGTIGAGLARYGTMLSMAGHFKNRDRKHVHGHARERERVLNAVSSIGQYQQFSPVNEMNRVSSLDARAVDATIALPPLGRQASGFRADAGGSICRRSERSVPEESARSTKARDLHTAAHRADPPPPPGLTPAEIIAHEYKQQAKRREELVQALSQDPGHSQMPEVPQRGKDKLNERDQQQKKARMLTDCTADMTVGRELEEKTGAPYYTVLGDRNERVIIGNARDSAYGLFQKDEYLVETGRALAAEIACAPQQRASEEEKPRPRTLRRKLSRKMSGKFKKECTKDASGQARDEHHVRASVENVDSHHVVQVRSSPTEERHSAMLPREKIIQTVRRNSLEGSNVESESGKVLSSTMSDATAYGQDERERLTSEATMKVKNNSEGTEKRHGHSLWGLVRKISQSALKEKGKNALACEAPPPVPALPVNLPETMSEMDGCIALSQLPKVKSSRSQRPSTAPTRNADAPLPFGRFRLRQPSGQLQQIPVETECIVRETRANNRTRSSSPMSSDLTSSSHNHGQSSQSSWSSFYNSGAGTTTPDAHKSQASIGQHILPPEKLNMLETLDLGFGPPHSLAGNDLTNRKLYDTNTKRTTTFTHTYDRPFYGEETTSHQALPAPPRRSNQVTTKFDEKLHVQTQLPLMYTNDHAAHSTFGLLAQSRPATAGSGRASPIFSPVDFGASNKASNAESFRPAEAVSPLLTSPLLEKAEPPSRFLGNARHAADAAVESIHSVLSLGDRGEGNVRVSRGSSGAASQSSTPTPRTSAAYEVQKPSQNLLHLPTMTTLTTSSAASVTTSTSASATISGSFREVGNVNGTSSKSDDGTRLGWTEKEKQAMWDDLLSRSDRAGGTLHLGFGGLLSDNLRDSVYSAQTVRTDSEYTE